jgi:hypothetical protein
VVYFRVKKREEHILSLSYIRLLLYDADGAVVIVKPSITDDGIS